MKNLTNDLYLTEYRKILARINKKGLAMHALSDEELQAKTPYFRDLLAHGKTTDDILVEAYAVIREAAGRVLGMFPFDVQVIGAIALHKGKIAEMRTGEGKTLVATMPLYLNALTGKSTILVTMNEYLAARDGHQMSALFSFMGLTTGIDVQEDPREKLTPAMKRKIYASDIVYATHGVLGFDYLLQNLGASKKDQYLRDYYYVIIDEADSVLLDSAQTPLVISGKPKVSSNLYGMADDFVQILKKDRDYVVDEEKDCYLTGAGAKRAERYFRLDNLYAQQNFELLRHIILALHAHTLFERERQYVVEGDKIELLDFQTGRIMDSTKLSAGMHQALEAKEHVPITQESRAMASITYQSFFHLFPRIAGMSGTAHVDAREFQEIYGLDVVTIPTNHPIARVDEKDLVYYNEESMLAAVLREVKDTHKTGQPVLVIASSILRTERFSEQLLRAGIPHNVLNAYNTAKEAEIIREAGQRNAVTIATAIAGRGTDIRLGPGINELGGLSVIGLGRMDNRRQEQQARGRAGRQGNNGSSRFYVCLEDEIVRRYGAERLQDIAAHHTGIAPAKVRRQINEAQLTGEATARTARRSTMEFGESMKAQRDLVYRMRNCLIQEGRTDKDYYMSIEAEVIDAFLKDCGRSLDPAMAARFIMDNITYSLRDFPEESETATTERAKRYLLNCASRRFDEKKSQIRTKRQLVNFFRLMTLKALDNAWIEQVDYLQQLRQAITGRAYAQRNIMFEYHREAYASFRKMTLDVKRHMMRNIFLGEIRYDEEGKASVLLP